MSEVIETERLLLEPLEERHAEQLFAVLDDEALHRFIGGRPDTMDELRARYRRLAVGSPVKGVQWCNWAIVWRENGRLAGTMQATITQEPHDLVAEVAWVVGTSWQGRGIAREAAKAVIERVGLQGATQIIAHIHPDHPASAAVATAAGLRPTSRLVDGEIEWELPG